MLTNTKVSIVLAATRLATVLVIVAGLSLITKRVVERSSATAGALTTLANVGVTPHVPSAAEVARLKVLSGRIDVIAENLSNRETQAYKRHRSELIADAQTNIHSLPLDMTEGALESTGGKLDVAITGNGFFRVKIPNGLGDGSGYTRNGSLCQNYWGDVIVGINEGYELIPPINIPPGSTDISIGLNGTLSYTTTGSTAKRIAGEIQLYTFANAQALATQGPFYLETAASGHPLAGAAGENGTGQLEQGFLECSNVDAIQEWVQLIKTEQLFQLNSRSLQIAGQARQTVAALEKQ